MKVLVVGSGPAAWASCHALIEKGIRPVVWDVADELDEKTREFKESLKGKTTFSLTEGDKKRLYKQEKEEFPKKRLYGSDFFHGFGKKHSPVLSEKELLAPTFAWGGLAVGWGGAMLPMHQDDMDNWSVTRSDLAPHFERVFANLPIAMGGDCDVALDAFPLEKETTGQLPISERLKKLQLNLNRNQKSDFCQVARLAFHTEGENACTGCGLCLTGCAEGSIFSFGAEFLKWHQEGKIEYVTGRTVTTISQEGEKPTITYLDKGNVAGSETFERVFLASGAISSTRIVLESLNKFDKPVHLLDSQKFILPMFQFKGADTSKPVFELPSLFWNFKFEEHWTHLQINEAGRFTREFLPKFLPLSLKKTIIDRMLIGWGGLHSDDSRSFNLTLLPAHRHGRPVLDIMPKGEVKDVAGKIRKLTWEMSKSLIKNGVYTLPPLAQIAPQGGGFHFGGTLAMAETPKSELETDKLGRISAWKAVHIVDGSVLPSIPATTVAVNIMANADRITSETLKDSA